MPANKIIPFPTTVAVRKLEGQRPGKVIVMPKAVPAPVRRAA